MPLKELSNHIKQQKISAFDIVSHAINKINQCNPTINAVIAKRFKTAIHEAKQIDLALPFAGTPILIKDLYADIKGLPSTHGCKGYAANIATSDSHVVTTLKALGFIIVGKTNTAEFGLSTTTEPKLFGPTKNPFDLSKTAGGSSGGAAAAVSSGMVPLAHASDAGGSIRIPAAYCGLVGLKPSRPANAKTLKEKITSQHVLTKTVKDTQLVLQHTRPELPPYKPEKKSYKIALIIEHPWHSISQVCQQKTYQAAEALQKQGHHIEVQPFYLDWKQCVETFITIIAKNLANHLPNIKNCELTTKLMATLGKQITPQQLTQAKQSLNHIHTQTQKFFSGYDFILTPTTATTAPKLNTHKLPLLQQWLIKTACTTKNCYLLHFIYNKLTQTMFKDAPFTMPFNLAGCPAISLPTAWEANNACAIQLVAPAYQDHKLLDTAQTLIQILPPIDTVNELF